MKRPQLTQAQRKFILLKSIHLLAVLLLVGGLFIYFHKAVPQEKTMPTVIPEETVVSANISGYEFFCQNNSDMKCGYSLTAKEADSAIILMDTDELNEEIKEQISKVASTGSDLNINPEDMNTLLDSLYEEKLPDDIIDINPTIKNPKMKGLHIIPDHKPPYFGSKPVVVIVIDDMGISQKRTADISSLKAPLTASFLTYGRRLDEQIQNSINNGQEIIVHVPMEAQTSVDVAPDVLTTKMSLSEIKKNLLTMLKKFKGIKGINNHMGSKLTEDYNRMKAVMEVLREEGLYFLDSKTSPKSRAEDAAADSGIAYAHRHVFLDNNNDKAYILGQLAKTEKLARKNGYAIAIGHPKTQTYAALKEWLPLAQKNGIKIVPLSYVISTLHPTLE